VDSQSPKTTGVGGNERGFDPAKKVEGRKRHLLVDTQGLVLEVRLHSAKVPDEDGIRLLLLDPVRDRFPRLSHPCGSTRATKGEARGGPRRRPWA
jgi:putative transposase